MMRKQLVKSVTGQVFRFSERCIYFILIITIVFHFGQSFSPDNPAVYVREGTLLKNYEATDTAVPAKNNDHSGFTSITGEEHIYVVDGTSLYGINKKAVNRILRKHASASLPGKYTAGNKPVRKKAVNYKPKPAQSITSYPDRNPASFISVSGQVFFTVPASHYQNFILHQHIRYFSTGQSGEYIFQNYHYLFSAFSKITLSEGGIRPPPVSLLSLLSEFSNMVFSAS